MDNHKLSEEEIASLSQEECFNKLIGMIKEMSREELIEFMQLTEMYKALHNGTSLYTS